MRSWEWTVISTRWFCSIKIKNKIEHKNNKYEYLQLKKEDRNHKKLKKFRGGGVWEEI